jgi:hypothetical protein
VSIFVCDIFQAHAGSDQDDGKAVASEQPGEKLMEADFQGADDHDCAGNKEVFVQQADAVQHDEQATAIPCEFSCPLPPPPSPPLDLQKAPLFSHLVQPSCNQHGVSILYYIGKISCFA